MSDPGTGNPALVVRHTGQVFPLGRSPLTIGGQESNTIILADPEVSPLHAVISLQGEEYIVADAGSAQGTYLDERRVKGSRRLRDGSVLRVGNTIFDVRIPPAAERIPQAGGGMPGSQEPAPSGPRRRTSLPVLLGLLVGGFVVICVATAAILLLQDQRRGRPTVTFQSPKENAQVLPGQSILLQATATGARDITRLELSVDGTVVGSADSADDRGQATLSASQAWTFDQVGSHTVSAVAYRAGRRAGTSVSHQVQVVGGTGTPGPTETPGTPTPSATATATSTETPTPTSTPTGTPVVLPVPVIEFFRAEPATIDAGACATLAWGEVTGAVAATIDHGIGGVATPGSQAVCPTETTRYVLTASGPGGATTASATVTVRTGQPDLTVDAISFSPNPPVQGQDALVQILLRNAGSAAAGPFSWEWQAGSAAPIAGSPQSGLGPGASVLVSLTWRPDRPYRELVTSARVDSGQAVAESDETNNELRQAVHVAPATETVTLRSQAGLDGTVTGGQGADPNGEIRVGNSPSAEGEWVQRGFLSFNLAEIPAGATIESVELRFYQLSYEGAPYAKLGDLQLEAVDYGSGLDVADFDLPALGSVSLPAVTPPGSWYVVSVGAIESWLVQARDAGRASFQLRLRFSVETDGDGQPDSIQVESGGNSLGTGNVPELIVTYSMP